MIDFKEIDMRILRVWQNRKEAYYKEGGKKSWNLYFTMIGHEDFAGLVE